MELLTLDESGRILIPQTVRERLRLHAQDQLSLEIKDGRLVLHPLPKEPKTEYEEGILVVKSDPIDNLDIINELREERIDELSLW